MHLHIAVVVFILRSSAATTTTRTANPLWSFLSRASDMNYDRVYVESYEHPTCSLMMLLCGDNVRSRRLLTGTFIASEAMPPPNQYRLNTRAVAAESTTCFFFTLLTYSRYDSHFSGNGLTEWLGC